MATAAKKSPARKKVIAKKSTAKTRSLQKKAVVAKRQPKSIAKKDAVRRVLARPFKKPIRLSKELLSRRPHRAFRRTHRRDYVRSLDLPGYIAFTHYVWRTLWERKRVFGGLLVVYGLLSAVLIGIASQETYTQLSDTLRETGQNIFSGGWGEVGKAGLLLTAGLSGNFGAQPTEVQQLYGVILGLMVWMTTVWLLRVQLAGNKPALRDGLYNAAAPLVATFLVTLVLVIQLLPAAFAIIGYTAALQTDFLANGGVVAMIFFVVALLLVILSLYLVTSTIIALVVVTLPGMYPWRALRIAGDLVIGRRVRILLRLVWGLAAVALLWIIIMLPVILLTTWLTQQVKWTASLPIVPIVLLLVSSTSIVFMSAYVYLLYRKVVDDDAAPA